MTPTRQDNTFSEYPMEHAELWNRKILLFASTTFSKTARGGAVGCGIDLQAGSTGIRFSMVSLEFVIDIILSAALWPWG